MLPALLSMYNFPESAAPQILHELHIIVPQELSGGKSTIISIEVEQQLGDGIVRCIALENIEGICRGLA